MGAAAVPVLRQEFAGHAKHVDDDFASVALDHVPIGQAVWEAEPVVQYEPAVHDRQELLDVALIDELYLPESQGLGMIEPERQ